MGSKKVCDWIVLVIECLPNSEGDRGQQNISGELVWKPDACVKGHLRENGKC